MPGAVVLLDGAGIPGSEGTCWHGVEWYVQRLGAALLAGLFRDLRCELAGALAGSVRHVVELHRHTCDITNPVSPQASVAVVRFAGEHAEYLVLGDTFVVLGPAEAGVQVVNDPREVTVRAECMSALQGVPATAPEYEQVLRETTTAFRQQRHRPGGFWVAKDDPDAAAHAVTGSVPLDGLHGVALLSNGASRIVDPYQLAQWPAVLDLVRTTGPDKVVRRVRAAESTAGGDAASSGVLCPDDATVAFCEPTSPSAEPATNGT